MVKGYTPILVLWIGGLAVAAVLAFAKGKVDLQSERSRQISHVSQLTTSLRIAFDNFTERNASDLARIIEVEMTSDTVGSWLVESPFISVALVDQDANGAWKVDWARSKMAANSVADFQGWLPKLPLEKMRGDFVSWNRVEVQGQRPSLILGVQLRLKTPTSEKNQIALGQLALDHLSPLTDPLKAEGAEIFLVDSAGYSLTFPNPQYIGSYMDVHPLVNAAVKAQTISDAGDFRNLSGEPTIGAFERVKNSNVYVIANVPTTAATVYISRQLFESGIVILGILILLSLPLALIGRSQTEKFLQLRQTLASVEHSTKSNRVEPQSVPAESVEKIKHDVFEKFAAIVYQQLKGPVYSALSKVSRLNPQSSQKLDDPNKSILISLESDLRKFKVFIEGLGRTFKQNERVGTEVNISKVLEAELAKNAEVLQKSKIEVEFSPGSNFVVKSHSEDIHKIFKTLIKDLPGKLRKSSQENSQRVTIRFEGYGPVARVSFLYHGVKLANGALERFFDIVSVDDLELSAVRGLANSWNGQLLAEDSLIGLRILLELPFAPGYEIGRTQVSETKKIESERIAEHAAEQAVEQRDGQTDERLNLKKVDEAISKALPPPPSNETTHVTVVPDLTMTSSKVPKSSDPNSEVKIRKPRVRMD